MQRKSLLLLGCSLAALAGLQNAAKAVTIDGSLDPAYGAALAVQTNTSNAGHAPNANPDSQRTPSQNQLSNAYGLIDTTNNQLDLFFGGAINLNDEFLSVAIDANPNVGVANTSASTFPGLNNGNSAYSQLVFDPGFRPETLWTFQFNGGNQIFDDNLLTGKEITDGYGADPQGGPVTRGPAAGDPAGGVNFTVAVNNALSGTLLTTANAGTAATGFEIGLNLSDLGYVAGSPVNVAAFITQGSGTSMTNQVLASNPGYGPDPFANYNFDFTADQGAGGHNAPGNQFFTVEPAATPEPASLGLLALGGSLLMGRRKRQA